MGDIALFTFQVLITLVLLGCIAFFSSLMFSVYIRIRNDGFITWWDSIW